MALQRCLDLPTAQATLAIQARRFQEVWLRQVRSLLTQFDHFRRICLDRKERDDWPQALFTFLVARLQGNPALRSTTLIQQMFTIGARLPGGLPKGRACDMLKGFASLDLLRPTGTQRGFHAATDRLLECARAQAAKSLTNKRVLMSCLLISQGQRRSDAVGMAAGQWAESPEWACPQWLILWPRTEKNDNFGMSIVEPVLLMIMMSDRPMIDAVLRAEELPDRKVQEIANATSAMVHSAGIPDVRCLRRDAAQAQESLDDARTLLRHRPGSRSTARYATTRTSVKKVRAVVSKTVRFE